MTPKKTIKRRAKGAGPSPHIVRPGGGVGGPSGYHKTEGKAGFMFRAPVDEVEEMTAAAAAAGLTRNDWLRLAAAEKLKKGKT